MLWHDAVQLLLYLLRAQVEGIGVQQELRLVVELWRELLDITAAVKAIDPGGRHIGKEAVCVIKPATLQLPVHACEGLHADQVKQNSTCTRQRYNCCSDICYHDDCHSDAWPDSEQV